MELQKPIQIIRKIWQVLFFLFILGIGFWLFRSLFITGNFFKSLYFYLPCALFLFLLAAIFYFFAFRFRNENSFANLNVSMGVLILLTLVSEAGIRIWDHYDPIFRPAYLEDVLSKIPGAYKGKGKFLGPYKPNSTGMTHGHTVRINNLGFRGTDYPIKKPTNGFRILVLGDSFTFGQGIGESDVYTPLLERELTARYPQKKIEVINLGVMGYSAVDEMNLLYRAGPLLNPDIILIGFTGNDVREGNQVTEPERNRLAFPLPNGIKFFLQSYFKLFGWLAEKYNQLLMNIGVRHDVFTSLESAYDMSSEEWKKFVAAYEKILEWTQRQSIPPPVVGLFLSTPSYDPNKNDFIDMTPNIRTYLRQIRQVERTLNNMGIHTVDYLPLFQRHNKQAMYVSKWEGHPNEAANQLYAEGFLRSILALNLIR